MKNALFALVLIVLAGLTVQAQEISSDFPFESKYVEVFGSQMHYIEEFTDTEDSDQLTFLFLHGNPTSNYLWRNIIPYVQGKGRAIAPDLIGLGKSDKPDIDYTFKDHIKYLDEFISKLNINKVVLVIHDWGSALGFHYAHRNPDKVQGIVFMEAVTDPITEENANFIQRFLFKRLRDDKKGHQMIVEDNFFIENIVFKSGTVRELTQEEKDYYAAPFKTEASRKPIQVFAKEIPFEGPEHYNYQIIHGYAQWLRETETPKLMLYASPGMVIRKKQVKQLTEELKELKTVHVGKGKHYIQEDAPHAIGQAIQEWIETL